MAQIIKQITVDVAKKNLFQAIVAKQNDSQSRFLQVAFVNEGQPILVEASSSVIINAERADNASKSFAGTVNDDGTVTVPLTTWMLELDDFVRCDVSIIDSESRRLSSMSFTIEVEAAANSSEDISDDENYDILITLLGDCADSKRECDAATASATAAAEFATNSSNLADEATVRTNDAIAAAETATRNAVTATGEAVEVTEATRIAKENADTATESANAAAEAARAAATAIGDEIDGVVIKDTTNNIDYIAKLRLVNGMPVIEYVQI